MLDVLPIFSSSNRVRNAALERHLLEVEANEDPGVVAARNRQLLSGPQPQIDVACDRVDSFIEKFTGKATA